MRRLERQRDGLRRLSTGVMLALLAACASRVPPPPGEAPPIPASPAPVVASSTGAPWPAFRQHHLSALEVAEQRGQWAQALWHLDVLLALEPGNLDLATRQGRIQAAGRQAATDRKQRARQARTRGEAELATRLYLEALAALPEDTEAMDALRALERERVKRQHLGQLSRNTLMRKPGTEPPGGSYGGAPTAAAAGPERNDLEHASLLASQGEIEGAIAVLQPLITSRKADPAVRRLLADLYVRQAESLLPGRRDAAISALERAVQVDPKHPRASARLKELVAAGPGEGTKATPARPPRASAR